MIRLLTEQDRQAVRSYLDKDPLHNILMIHGLRCQGLESDNVRFWGAFRRGRLEGVLYAEDGDAYRFCCLAGDHASVLSSLGRFALRVKGKQLWFGKSSSIEPAISNLHARIRTDVQSLNYYEIRPEQLVSYYDHPVRTATEDDIPQLVELYRDYEFYGKTDTEERIAQEIRKTMEESGVYFLVELDGRIVCAARVYPETDQAGLIGRARTLPEFRGRGMYPSVRTACFEHLFRKGKIGLGYFVETNVNMTRVLEKQGGTITAKWLLASLREKPSLIRRTFIAPLRHWGRTVRDAILRR